MNNYYALIYLSDHIKSKSIGAFYTYGYSPHRNVWEGYFKSGSEEFRLIFSADSRETALFTDSYRNPKKSNVISFFEDLREKTITEVHLAEADRWIEITFDNRDSLLFQLFGNTPNIFLIRDGLIMEAFKSPDNWLGKIKPEPRPPRPMPDLSESWSPKTVITKTDPKFPRHLISPVIQHYDMDEKTPAEIRALTLSLSRQMQDDAEFRVLEDGNLCLISRQNLPLPELRQFISINEAVKYAYYKTSRERRLSKRIDSIRPRLEDAIAKTERTISQLEKADKALERADKYENYGHILMAHAHEEIDMGTEEVTYPDFYNDNEPVVISVKPDRSIAENARYYYERSSKAKKRVQESKKRMITLKQELSKLQQIWESFRKLEKIYEFDDWFEEHKSSLTRLGVLSQNQQTESLPFRKSQLGSYEIWIGKNAKSNDEVTSRAHKEDIWLHARGVGGSHVVIRMNNDKEYPPREIILKAASAAAWNSKARGTKLTPVIFTKRKYVSKPKGSPAGTVRVHREEVEMVEPKKLSEWKNLN